MPIRDPQLDEYLQRLRPQRDPLLGEMEALAQRDGIPIVNWETGRFLATVCRALDPVVLEVGTAIGYSTLHMARELRNGRVVTLELNPERVMQARGFLLQGEVDGRVDVIEGDARDSLLSLEGPFDLLFIDAAKTQYGEYLSLAEGKLSERAVLVVDNLLMSGEAALPAGAESRWSHDSLDAARRFNEEILSAQGAWLGSVLPVGDGVGFATRR